MRAIVKHYVGSETVTLKAFHDEWEIAEPREEVQHLADRINELQAGSGKAVAWASPLPDGTEQVTKELPERIYGLVPRDYQWYVRPLVYGDTHPQPAQQGSVPEASCPRCKGKGHHAIGPIDCPAIKVCQLCSAPTPPAEGAE